MEPPLKRLKIAQALYNAVEEEEEEEIQDELAMTPFQFNARQDPLYELDKSRAKAATRLKSTFEHIFDKYEKDFTGIGDEIDLETGEIIVNNGHIESMRNINEDGSRSDEESTSSAEEERIVGGKSNDKPQSESVIEATSFSSIDSTASNRWADPFAVDSSFSSLAMAPSPFGTPPPFSFGSPFPGGQPADPAWRAPEIPVSLFQDNLGFRNQFMGFPGSVEYNSFGQPRIRTSYRDVFGRPPPKKFTTAKAFARKALPTTAQDEITETEEDDILLGRPHLVPELVENAISPIDPPDLDKPIPNAGGSATEDENNTAEKDTRKATRRRRRFRKATVVKSTDSIREMAVSNLVGNGAASDAPSVATQQTPDTPEVPTSELSNSQLPRRNLSPAKNAVPARVKKSDQVPNETGQLDRGHRRSTRARKEPDFFGRTQGQKPRKQGSVASGNMVEDAGGRLAVHMQRVTRKSSYTSDTAMLGEEQNEGATICDDQSSDISVDGTETVLYLRRGQQTVQAPEIPVSPSSRDSSVLTGHRGSHRFTENLRSIISANDEVTQVPSSSVSDIAGDKAEARKVEPQLGEETSEKETNPTGTTITENVEEQPQNPKSSGDITRRGVIGKHVDPDPDPDVADSVDSGEPVDDADTANAEKERNIGLPGSRDILRGDTADETPENVPSRATRRNKPSSRELVQRPHKPEMARVLRPRKQSPVRITDSPAGTPRKVLGDADNRDGVSAGAEVAAKTITPKRRTRNVATRTLPPESRDGETTSEIVAAQDGQPDSAPAKSPTRRRHRGPTAQKHKPPTPETPKRRRSRDATTTTTKATAAVPSSSSSSSTEKNTGRRKSKTASASSPPLSSSKSATTTTTSLLSVPAKRFALSSLIPDDPEYGEELDILTPTSSTSNAAAPIFTAALTPSFRARLNGHSLGLGGAIPATTPRRPPGHKYSGGGVQSSPLARTVAARSSLLLSTPPRRLRLTGKTAATDSRGGSVVGSSPVAGGGEQRQQQEQDDTGGLTRTPNGTLRRCGEDGFVCNREFCFTCCR